MEQKLHKLLAIDDDEDILAVVKYSLAIIPDLTVTCVTSGEEGVKAALREPPNIILLDLMMPVMDGFMTLKALRLIPSLADIPVIFFTAKVQVAEVANYRKQGAYEVILKPFDPVTLPQELIRIWEKYTSKGS